MTVPTEILHMQNSSVQGGEPHSQFPSPLIVVPGRPSSPLPTASILRKVHPSPAHVKFEPPLQPIDLGDHLLLQNLNMRWVLNTHTSQCVETKCSNHQKRGNTLCFWSTQKSGRAESGSLQWVAVSWRPATCHNSATFTCHCKIHTMGSKTGCE